MATFALVGCTQAALSAAGPAYLMCRSNDGFAAAWERANAEADAALILSPEYGLLHPDEVLRPGDEGLGDERWQKNPDAWLQRIQHELMALRWLEVRHRWMILAEGEWADRVSRFLRDSAQEVASTAAVPESPAAGDGAV